MNQWTAYQWITGFRFNRMTDNQQNDDNQKNGNSIKRIVGSKDVKCPVCLATITNRAVTDSCSHEFCFECISQWSANHNRCPICRQIYSNIKYNIVSNESFEELPVEEQPELEEDQIEAILHRMLLYLRLLGLRNRTQRRRDQLRQELNQLEERVDGSDCDEKENEESIQKMVVMRSQLKAMDEELRRFNHTVSAENPSNEELMEALSGREDEIQDIEVLDLILDPDDIDLGGQDDRIETDSSESMPPLVEANDSGNESDDEHESEDEAVNSRKRKPSPDHSDDSGQSSPKRKRQ